MTDPFYLPMDCPNCGRARLLVYPDEVVMECEKCGASAFDCDNEEHMAGGLHAQTVREYWSHSGARP